MKVHIGFFPMPGIAMLKIFECCLHEINRVLVFQLILFISLLSSVSGWTQDSVAVNTARFDTIYATTTKTTSLIFPSRITIYDIGSEDFGGIKEDNLLLLKAAHEGALPTSLIIKYGASLYHGTLAYRNIPPNLFIDFSKVAAIPQLPNDTRMAKDDSIKSLDEKMSEKRLSLLLSDPKSYYKNNAVKDAKERIVLTLTDLRTDENNVYLKLLLINDSKLDYQLDFVEFIYQNPLEQKDMKGAYDKKNVYPHSSNHIDVIKGKEQRHIGYSIPRYTLGKKGELLLIVREKNGSRSITLALPFSLILEAKKINQ